MDVQHHDDARILGKITLYRGKEPVLRHIPDTEAVDRLLELIENDKKTKI